MHLELILTVTFDMHFGYQEAVTREKCHVWVLERYFVFQMFWNPFYIRNPYILYMNSGLHNLHSNLHWPSQTQSHLTKLPKLPTFL